MNRNRIWNMVCLSTRNFLTSLHSHLWPQNNLSVFTRKPFNPACFAYLWRLHITGSDSTSDHCSSFAWWKREKHTWTGPWTTMTTTFAENAKRIQEATADLTSCQVDFQLDHSSFRNALWCWQLEAEVKTPGTWATVNYSSFVVSKARQPRMIVWYMGYISCNVWTGREVSGFSPKLSG